MPLSCRGPPSPPRGLLDEHLQELVKNAAVPVFVGGRVAVRSAAAIEKTGAIPVGQDLPPAFKQIGAVLSRTPQG